MSEVPCTSVRASMGVRSAMIVEAATVAQDQPRPSRNSPAKICHDVPCGDRPHSTSDTSRTTPPVTRTADLPKRSAAQPTSGEKANMPRTWMEMTNPMTSRCAPPCSMCSGVMIITVTIAAWAQAIADHRRPDRRHVAHHRGEAGPRPAARLGTCAGHDPGGLLGEEQRVGSQPPPHPPGRDDQDDRADGEATGQLGHAHGAGDGSLPRR